MGLIMKYQYFSKWRRKWIDFPNSPTKGELYLMEKCHYQIRVINKSCK